MAGRDFKIHTTVLEAIDKDGEPDRSTKFTEIDKTDAIASLNDLVGKKLQFKYLLLGGNTVILTTIAIPDWLTTKREVLAQAYQEQGLSPLQLVSILHRVLSS